MFLVKPVDVQLLAQHPLPGSGMKSSHIPFEKTGTK
jgi:hypothetical protein